MKTRLAAICLFALALCVQGQHSGLVTTFGIDDAIVMNRTATAFQGESGPAQGAGHVEYFVCRCRKKPSIPDPDAPRYARAAEIGGERNATPPGNALLQLGMDTLWRAILP